MQHPKTSSLLLLLGLLGLTQAQQTLTTTLPEGGTSALASILSSLTKSEGALPSEASVLLSSLAEVTGSHASSVAHSSSAAESSSSAVASSSAHASSSAKASSSSEAEKSSSAEASSSSNKPATAGGELATTTDAAGKTVTTEAATGGAPTAAAVGGVAAAGLLAMLPALL